MDSFASGHRHHQQPIHRRNPSTSSSIASLPPLSADRKRTLSESETDLPSPPVTPRADGNDPSSSNNNRDDNRRDGDDTNINNISKKRRTDYPLEKEGSLPRDPLLFPRQDQDVIVADGSLFGPILPPPPTSADLLVDQHIDSHMASFKDKRNRPTRDEYLLALSCVPIVSAQYNRSPSAWARKERETLERQITLMNRYRASTPVRGDRKKKVLSAKRPAATATAATTAVHPPRVQRTPRVKPRTTPKSTPRQKVVDSFDTPLVVKAVRPIATNRDDTDYHSLPDFSPPIESLGANAKVLKADWKGQVLDLSHDPERHLLSPAEQNLAATLRLSCATYLCSKRRIFEARVRALLVGKEFRKTDAQQACKIDVNKASKLWTAYDRVGWFKPEYFRQYLR